MSLTPLINLLTTCVSIVIMTFDLHICVCLCNFRAVLPQKALAAVGSLHKLSASAAYQLHNAD